MSKRVARSAPAPKRDTPTRLPFKSAAELISGRAISRYSSLLRKPAIMTRSAPCSFGADINEPVISPKAILPAISARCTKALSR